MDYWDSVVPEFELDFPAPEEVAAVMAADYDAVYSPGGWTEDLIEEYEAYLEAEGVPNAYSAAF